MVAAGAVAVGVAVDEDDAAVAGAVAVAVVVEGAVAPVAGVEDGAATVLLLLPRAKGGTALELFSGPAPGVADAVIIGELLRDNEAFTVGAPVLPLGTKAEAVALKRELLMFVRLLQPELDWRRTVDQPQYSREDAGVTRDSLQSIDMGRKDRESLQGVVGLMKILARLGEMKQGRDGEKRSKSQT